MRAVRHVRFSTRRRFLGLLAATATAVATTVVATAPAALAAVGPVVTTQASTPITLGAGSISDSATVTTAIGAAPTGNVTFDLFGPNDGTCAGSVVFSSTNPLTAGDAQSSPYTPTLGGTYRYIATYDDGTNPPVPGTCNSPNESVTVAPAPSSISTQASTPIMFGAGTISDSATVTTTSGWPPTGFVTFKVYGPDDTECSAVAFTSTNPVTDGDAQSDQFIPTAPGTYRFSARYDGDSNNAPVTGSCFDPAESTQVSLPATSVTTQASAPFTFGSGGTISDSATVTTTSGFPPTDMVTFEIYGPDATGCAGDPIDTSMGQVTNGDAASVPFTPVRGGVYRFRAYYNGDSNNAPSDAVCDQPNESVTVNAAPSSMTTQASASVVWGFGAISDTATVTTTSGLLADGTVTFDVFGPDKSTCAGPPAFTSTNPVTNGEAHSTPFSPGLPGDYRFIAHYSGDGSNAAVDGACNDTDELTTVTVPPGVGGGGSSPSPSASASPSTSSSPDGTRAALTLTVRTPVIDAGHTATLVGTGAPNEVYRLLCYTRPSTTYFTARAGAFDAAGNPVTFTLALGRNTRCFLQYAANSTQGASPSLVINVRTVLSLSARRTGVRTYVFEGRDLPRVAGQLITLYRVDNAGNEIRTSVVLTDGSGIYRMTRPFTGTGTFPFKVRTGQTLNNAAGVSRTISVNIR